MINKFYNVEKAKRQVNGEFYMDVISPDMIIAYEGVMTPRLGEYCQIYPNLEVYVLNCNDEAINMYGKKYKDVDNVLFMTKNETAMCPVHSLIADLDFSKERKELVIQMNGILSHLIQFNKDDIKEKGFKAALDEVRRDIIEELLQAGVEDLEYDSLDVYLAYSDFFLPNEIDRLSDAITHELVRNADYKFFNTNYVEKNSLSWSDPKVFMEYMLLSRGAKSMDYLKSLMAQDRPMLSSFNLTEDDVDDLDSMGEEIYTEKFIPAAFADGAKSRGFEINFPYYFNKLIKL